MDAIKTYLDNVFAAFPRTEKAQALKLEMLANMEEKYRALKAEGKSEHEAVGNVIANFGSIDEIGAELGDDEQDCKQARKRACKQDAAGAESGISLSGGEARDYLAQSRKSGVLIGLGVWLILAGASAMFLIRGLTEAPNAAGILAALLAVAIAVPIFIMNWMRMERFEHYELQDVRLDAQTRAELELQRAAFMPRFAAKISAGVGMIIIAAGIFIFLKTQGYETLQFVLLLLTIGFAVFLFVTSCKAKSAFDILLNLGDYADRATDNKTEKIIGVVASIYWPLMAAAYLLWSFIGNAWAISWVIWPVAGIAFGAICGGVNAWLKPAGK